MDERFESGGYTGGIEEMETETTVKDNEDNDSRRKRQIEQKKLIKISYLKSVVLKDILLAVGYEKQKSEKELPDSFLNYLNTCLHPMRV